jgi:hypothetical protein
MKGQINGTGRFSSLIAGAIGRVLSPLDRAIDGIERVLKAALVSVQGSAPYAAAARFIRSTLWYLPAIFVAAVGAAAVWSPRLALWIILGGCLVLAGALLLAARMIKTRYHALLQRMPKIDGQAPKRLEFHAVIMGVGERGLGGDSQAADRFDEETDSMNLDDYLDELDTEILEDRAVGNDSTKPTSSGAVNSRTGSATGNPSGSAATGTDKPHHKDLKNDAAKVTSEQSDDSTPEDSSSFEIYEVPIVERDRVRKVVIH